MSLKKKLSYRSTLLFIVTMLFVTVGTYLLSRYYMERTYQQELLSIARLSAMFYLEKDEVNAKTHLRIEEEFKKVSNASIQLYKADSTLHFHDSIQHEVSADIINQTVEDGKQFFNIGPRSYLSFYYQDNEGDFVILVSGLNENGADQLRTLGRMLIFFGLLGTALHLVFSTLLSQKTFEPFDQLITQVRSIRGNDWHARLSFPRKDDDEIKQFISEFNHLLDRIESSVSIQRNFLRNASHELKTPLAIIIGDIEVALNSRRNTEEYVAVLAGVKKNGLHLRSIIENLMTLSDLEVAGTDLITPFRIDEVIWDVVEKKSIEYRGRKIDVHFRDGADSNEDMLTIRANRALMLIAINNIVDNAIKYSQQAVDIVIHATASPLKLEIIDTGLGIAAEELEQIFQIFYRGAATQHIQGHGIGLYLARQIFHLNGAEVAVESSPEHGTRFIITFAPSFTKL